MSSQISYIESLMPNMMLLGSEALGHEGVALINEIGALIKETPESSLVPSFEDTMRNLIRRRPCLDCAGILISDFQPSKL